MACPDAGGCRGSNDQGLGLSWRGYHVRWGGQVLVLVYPEFPGSTNTSLDLVDDENDVVLDSNVTKALEE